MFFVRVCDGCGRRVSGACDGCARALAALDRPSVRGAHVGFAYEGVVRQLIIGLKYRNHRDNARLLVDALLARVGPLPEVDVVTWVPTTRLRVRRRGVDHAELLARRMGRRLGVAVQRNLVKTSAEPQTGRTRRQRMVGPTFVPRSMRPGMRVMVVDDVVTTGTSLDRARVALVAAGASCVVCVAVAATPAPDSGG
jgi:predicted amidophosphoribosyltransferase